MVAIDEVWKIALEIKVIGEGYEVVILGLKNIILDKILTAYNEIIYYFYTL